jgi:maltose alpha-D-glucosyltransferase/alpha-amylase
MQWTPDRNAGFSAADPGKLYLPTVQSLVYHYQAVNVEAQLATGSSLLHWVRSVLAVRRQHPAFGRGDYLQLTSRDEEAHCSNEAVLAFLRVLERSGEAEGETVLCVNNLSDHPQAASLRLPGYAGARLRDVFGGAPFGTVDADGRVEVTCGSRGFYWLTVEAS